MTSVLVTGASTGIGAATVAALVERGDRVWAAVRRDENAAGPPEFLPISALRDQLEVDVIGWLWVIQAGDAGDRA